MVFCMMTDSSSESEDNLFLLAAFALSLNFAQERQTKEEDSRIEESAIFFLTFSLSVNLFHLCADWPGEPSTHRK